MHQLLCDRTRANLGSGPWDGEPDRVEFQHVGMPCLMLRHPDIFSWCGYVGVYMGHPLYEIDSSSAELVNKNLIVHGGLTYSGHGKATLCSAALRESSEEPLWFFGFDCAHMGDAMPVLDKFRTVLFGRSGDIDTSTYRNLDYVRAETMRLAEALRDTTGIN